jgi:hypothetical protein
MSETKNINNSTETAEINLNNLIKSKNDLLPTTDGSKFLYFLFNTFSFGIFSAVNHHNINKVILGLNDSISGIDLKFKSKLNLIKELLDIFNLDSEMTKYIKKRIRALSTIDIINYENREIFSKMINDIDIVLNEYISKNDLISNPEFSKKIEDFNFITNEIIQNRKIYNESISTLAKLANKFPTNIIIHNKKIPNFDYFKS